MLVSKEIKEMQKLSDKLKKRLLEDNKIYEDKGQKELRQLKDKFVYTEYQKSCEIIEDFNNFVWSL